MDLMKRSEDGLWRKQSLDNRSAIEFLMPDFE